MSDDTSKNHAIVISSIEQDLKKKDYRIIKKLGEGAQSFVYLVENISNSIKYAVKISEYGIEYSSSKKEKSVSFSKEGYPTPFFEIRLGMLSTSPYLLKYLDFFVGEKYMYAFTELHTSDLSIALWKGCKMSPYEKVEHVFKLGCGLEYLHTNRILHCDLKLENILVSPHRVVISDLGLTGYANSDDEYRGCHAINFRAPEYIFEEKDKYNPRDYHSIFGDLHSTLEEGEYWSYGIICLYIIYGIYEFDSFKKNMIQHPKFTSYHKKQDSYIAFINLFSITKECPLEEILGSFSPGSIEKELITLLQKYVLILTPSKRVPIREFLKDPFFKKLGFSFEKENMQLPLPLVKTTLPFSEYIPREIHSVLRTTITFMMEVSDYFKLCSLILMDAIDYLLQKYISLSIQEEKLRLFALISIFIMTLIHNYDVRDRFTIANIIKVSKINISFRMFYDHLMNTISLEKGRFLFESLYFHLDTEEEVAYGRILQTKHLDQYLSFKNPREASVFIKSRVGVSKTKKIIRIPLFSD